mgnify:CR=1 FL=1
MTPSKPPPVSKASPEPSGNPGGAAGHPPAAGAVASLTQRPMARQFVLPSDCRAARPVQDELLDTLVRLDYHETAVFAVKLAVEEAVTNAIRHGNRMDPSRQVRIGWSADAGEVVVTVADEGPGFDPDALPDPTAAENLELPNGRGVMLMRAFMSEVVFSPVGNQVWLRKRNEPSSF